MEDDSKKIQIIGDHDAFVRLHLDYEELGIGFV